MARLAVVVLVAAMVAGCGSARRGVPVLGPMRLTGPAAAGEVAFMAHCHQCHPAGEAGIGPALNNKWLPGWVIRAQVRLGLGAMPWFSREEVSPERLDLIVAYLQAMRRRG
ncbi:MAG: cytochrome c [Pseudomonadota bacterium]